MKVVLLCGGIGKRMYPITEEKFLLKFLGRPLLQHQIESASSAGLKEFIIIVNRRNKEKVNETVKVIKGIEVEFAIQQKPLGMANALESITEFLPKEVILIGSNDVFDKESYLSLLEEYKKSPALSYILAHKVRDYFPGGYLVVNERNELAHLVEKPERGKEPSNLVNLVVHLHSDTRRLLEAIKGVRSGRDDVYEVALQSLVDQGFKVIVKEYAGHWIAIKYPWHILDVTEHFLSHIQRRISPDAKISPSAVIEGDVIIEVGVKVLENAVIRGPCYIGKNSVIGNNTLIRDYTHIGDRCVVGFSTEIKHSYICDDCWFHSNYIGDSVIAERCSFGAGTITANWRFDEKNITIKIGGEIIDTRKGKLGAIVGSNCKTGINASINVGSLIGDHAFIGPGAMVSGVVLPGSQIF